jgi:hypothetical protein
MIMGGLLNGLESEVGGVMSFLNGLAVSIPAALNADLSAQVNGGAGQQGNSRTLQYYAADGAPSFSADEELFTAMKRAKVVTPGW